MKRRSVLSVDLVTTLIVGPVIIFVLLATGLMASLMLYKVVYGFGDSSSPSAAVDTRLVRQPALPAPDAPRIVSHLAEPAALREATPAPLRPRRPTPTPAPGLISRWLGAVMKPFTSPGTPVIRTHLPTLTPTPGSQPAVSAAPVAAQPPAQVQPAATAAPAAVVAPVAVPVPAEPVVPDASAEVSPPGDIVAEEPDQSGADWTFMGIQTTFNPDEAVVKGVLINNTGTPQEAAEVTGTFYDAQGQVIQDQIDMSSYIPVNIIPVDTHIPFELDAVSPVQVSRVDLQVQSSPATNAPRQDFQIAGMNQWTDADGMYCLGGQVNNPGSAVQEYLTVYAALYNDRGKLVSFSDFAPGLDEIQSSSQGTAFEMCLDPLGEQITRYEINVVGF